MSTRAEFLDTKKKGENILIQIIGPLNKHMEHSIDPEVQPNYRTEAAFNEICVALALWEEHRGKTENQG